MTKLGHQQAPDPVDDDDLVTKRFGDANYAGGGIGTAALGDYLFAKLVAPVVYADAGVITFDTIEEQRGSITLVGGQFSLKAGRTYQMVATIQMTHTTGAVIPYQWRDATGAVLLGTVARAITDTGSSNGTSSQPSAYVFTPLVDTLVEVQMQAGGSTGADAVDGWAMVTEIGTVLAEVIGGLEFMDRFSPSTPVASFSFGASGDGVFKRELDGDVDEEYVLIHRLDTTSTVSSIELRPNGITTNQTSKRSTIQSSSGTFATMAIAQPSTVGYEIGTTTFDAKTGRVRSYHTEAALQNQDPATQAGNFSRVYAGAWQETVTNITSLEIATNDASAGIDVDSEFTLYRRTRSNLRADSADTYERKVEAAVAPGTATEEFTTGHTAFGGSAIGLTARIENPVTGGTIVVNLKVDGVTVLSTILNTTNPTSNRAVAPLGVFRHGADKNVSVEVVATGYTNAGSITSGLSVVGVLVNDALIQSQNQAYMPGHVDGMEMTFATVATVSIAAGTARDSANTGNIDVTGTLTANIANGGANGLDTGTEASNTWYALYVIADSTNTSAPAALLSVSFSLPIMPAGYDLFRRVGAVRNGSASDFLEFQQDGSSRDRWVHYFPADTNTILSGGSATGDSPISAASFVPPTSFEAMFYATFQNTAAADKISFSLLGAPVTREFRVGVITSSSYAFEFRHALFGAQLFRYRVTQGTNSLFINVTGYKDKL